MSNANNEISTWIAQVREEEIHKAGNAQGLIDWYNAGADGQINWGSPGDFDACVSIAGKHLDNPEGFCQLRHIDATGEPAGKAGGEVSKADEPNYAKLISDRKGEPTDKELYARVKAEAKSKFNVYPSAVANGWVVQEYKRRGGKYSKHVAKADSVSATYTPSAQHSIESAEDSARKGDQLRKDERWDSAKFAHTFSASKYRQGASQERSSNHPNASSNADVLEAKANEQDQMSALCDQMAHGEQNSPAEINKYENPPFKRGKQDWGYLDPAENVLLPDVVAELEDEDESSSSTDHIQPISVAYVQGTQADATPKK